MVKNLPANAGDSRDVGLIPGSERFPWCRKWQAIPVCFPIKCHRPRSLAGYSPGGHKESDTTEWLNTHTLHWPYIIPGCLLPCQSHQKNTKASNMHMHFQSMWGKIQLFWSLTDLIHADKPGLKCWMTRSLYWVSKALLYKLCDFRWIIYPLSLSSFSTGQI